MRSSTIKIPPCFHCLAREANRGIHICSTTESSQTRGQICVLCFSCIKLLCALCPQTGNNLLCRGCGDEAVFLRSSYLEGRVTRSKALFTAPITGRFGDKSSVERVWYDFQKAGTLMIQNMSREGRLYDLEERNQSLCRGWIYADATARNNSTSYLRELEAMDYDAREATLDQHIERHLESYTYYALDNIFYWYVQAKKLNVSMESWINTAEYESAEFIVQTRLATEDETAFWAQVVQPGGPAQFLVEPPHSWPSALERHLEADDTCTGSVYTSIHGRYEDSIRPQDDYYWCMRLQDRPVAEPELGVPDFRGLPWRPLWKLVCLKDAEIRHVKFLEDDSDVWLRGHQDE